MIRATCGVFRLAKRRLLAQRIHKPFLSILALYPVGFGQRSLLRSDIGTQQSAIDHSVKEGGPFLEGAPV